MKKVKEPKPRRVTIPMSEKMAARLAKEKAIRISARAAFEETSIAKLLEDMYLKLAFGKGSRS